MAVTPFKLAEQVKRIVGGGSWQEYITAINQAYGIAVKKSFFEGKNDGVSEIDGAFIYTFKNIDVVLDDDLKMYYAIMPGGYVDLPHELGVQSISTMQSSDKPFVRLQTQQWAMMQNLKMSQLEGERPYYIENNRIYLPTIVAADNVDKLLIKLSVSLDALEPNEVINIPADTQAFIVNMVVEQYLGKKDTK